MRKILFGHPLGNPNAREAARALHECGLLDGVATSFSFDEQSALGRGVNGLPEFARRPLKRELARRAWLPPEVLKYPRRRSSELAYSAGLALGRGLGPSVRGRLAESLYRAFDRHLSVEILRRSEQIHGVYLYEDGAADSFRQAKEFGLRCIYDLPTAFYKFNAALFADEAGAFPELRNQLVLNEARWKIERKQREIELADHIVVASRFVARSLEGHASCSISIVPYGAPSPTELFQQPTDFRAIYVGRVGPRKGVHYLLKAWRESGLPRGELELVGIDDFPAGWLVERLLGARYHGSIPYAELDSVYRRASVLVLPTLSDGFGLVLLEAMARGVPVIATLNSGAADIIDDGVHGFLVPIRDSRAIAEKVVWCREHPEELAEMSRAARRRAEELSWQSYRSRLGAVVASVVA